MKNNHRQRRKVLIVGNDHSTLSSLARIFNDHGIAVTVARSRASATTYLRSDEFGLLLYDVFANPFEAARLFDVARRESPQLSVVAITGSKSIDLGTHLMDIAAELQDKSIITNFLDHKIWQLLFDNFICCSKPPKKGQTPSWGSDCVTGKKFQLGIA